MKKAVIIGCGPAGISASLYIKRAGIDVVVIGTEKTALMNAEFIENYYGFAKPISGIKLFKEGIAQAKRLGTHVINDEVTSIVGIDKFIVKTASNEEITANAIVLATGKTRLASKINGLAEFEGHGVSYCAICDAFFYKNKHVAVIGNGAYALSEARELLALANVTILTNGLASDIVKLSGINYSELEIEKVYGESKVKGILFKNKETLEVDGIFVAIGFASSLDFAKKLGIFTENNRIITNEKQETNLPGIYAAGDCATDINQIATAVSQGAIAGISVINFLRK